MGVVVAPQAPAGRGHRVDGPVGHRGDDLRPAVAGDVDHRRRGDAARRVVVVAAAHGRLAAEWQVGEAAVPAGRARTAVLRPVEHHERIVLGLVGLLHLGVRQPDHLVVPVAVEVGDRRRRGRPLQPARLAHVGPRADVAVVLVGLDGRAQPADELPPAEPHAHLAARAVREPRRGEHRRAVVVEDVDLVVVEGDDDLQLRVVVEVADPDVLAVGAVAVVADAVEVGVVARPGQRVEPRPRRRGRSGRPVQPTRRVEDEDLRPGSARCSSSSPRPRGAPSPSRSAAAMPRASGHCPPLHVDAGQPGLSCNCPPTRLYAATVPSLPPTTISGTLSPSRSATTLRRVDPALRRRPLAERASLGVEHECRVGRRDDLQPAVAVEVDEARRREPAGLAGGDPAHEARRRHLGLVLGPHAVRRLQRRRGCAGRVAGQGQRGHDHQQDDRGRRACGGRRMAGTLLAPSSGPARSRPPAATRARSPADPRSPARRCPAARGRRRRATGAGRRRRRA